MQIRRARQGLLVFAGFLIPLSLFGYWFYVAIGNELPILPSLPLMLSPGLASVFTRLLRREGFADVSFRLHGPRMGSAYLLAFGLPLVVGSVAYGFAYLLGLARFDPPAFPFAVSPPLAQFGLNLLFAAIFILLELPSSAGEEIGWRGYLLLRMIDAHLPQPILLTSLIWGVWHLPVLFAGVYAVGPSPLLSAAGLMISALAVGAILAWIRLGTGSIWPCIVLHAAWNTIINGAFTPATQNATANFWIGEQGILVSVTLVLAALLLRRSWSPTYAAKVE
jgi:membrane protease YdiL (CAAX protease family)